MTVERLSHPPPLDCAATRHEMNRLRLRKRKREEQNLKQTSLRRSRSFLLVHRQSVRGSAILQVKQSVRWKRRKERERDGPITWSEASLPDTPHGRGCTTGTCTRYHSKFQIRSPQIHVKLEPTSSPAAPPLNRRSRLKLED